MRKFLNLIVGVVSAGVCALMLWISYDAGRETFIFNSAFCATMLFLIILSLAVGFRRSEKLKKSFRSISKRIDEKDIEQIHFGIRILDEKFGKYLSYHHKTDGAGNIADYISEEAISSYTIQSLLELIPDALTGLGILGTFIGLIWGLKGFDPVSYEAMASSITSLIDGIKVAFITSIMGISLSLAFSFWLKGEERTLSDEYENFLDHFCSFLAPEKEILAMDTIVENQRKQTGKMDIMLEKIPESTAVSVAEKLDTVTVKLSKTLDRFVNIVTLNQQELVDTVAKSVTTAMTKEFVSEFRDLKDLLDVSNKAQTENIRQISNMHSDYAKTLDTSAKKMMLAMQEDEARRRELTSEFKDQQKILTEFVDNVNSVLERMSDSAYEDLNTRIAMTKQVETNQKLSDEMNQAVMRIHKESTQFIKDLVDMKSMQVEVPQIQDINDKLDEVVKELESFYKQKKGLRR